MASLLVSFHDWMRKTVKVMVVAATTEREGKLLVSSLGPDERAREFGPVAGRLR